MNSPRSLTRAMSKAMRMHGSNTRASWKIAVAIMKCAATNYVCAAASIRTLIRARVTVAVGNIDKPDKPFWESD